MLVAFNDADLGRHLSNCERNELSPISFEIAANTKPKIRAFGVAVITIRQP